MRRIVKNEFVKSRKNIEKEHLICCIDLMIGLKKEQRKRLKNMSFEQVEHFYKMKFLEHNDEILVK